MLRLRATACIAYSLFIAGGYIAIASPHTITDTCITAFSIGSLLGLFYLLLPPHGLKRILFSSITEEQYEAYTKERFEIPFVIPRPFRSLLLAQAFFLLLSWVFFYTMEFQTRHNARVQPLEPGTLITLMQADSLMLLFCPWVCFAVCGVGLAYLSIALREQRSPTLPEAIFPEYQKHPALFFHNFCKLIVDTMQLGPPIFLFILASVWCAEACSISFGFPSLFHYPWKTTMAFVLIVLVLRNSQQKFLDYLSTRKVPLGGILALYALGVALFLFWIHSTGSWFILGIEETDPNKVMKSPLAGSFTPEELQHRLRLLIWGWWAIWLPHFASLVARLSIGKRIFEACLQAIILPACLFLLLLPRLDPALLRGLFPRELSVAAHFGISIFLLFALMLIFGKVHNTAELARGAMPSGIGPALRARPLNKWFSSMFLIFVSTLTGEYLLGFVPAQVIVTLGAIFMMSVYFIFLWRLFLTKAPAVGVKKYKVPSES